MLEKQKGRKQQANSIQFVIPINYQSVHVNKDIGHMLVGVGDSSLIQAKWEMWTDIVVIAIGIFVLLAIGSWIFVGYVVTKPLGAILMAIRQSKLDQTYAVIDYFPKDEFGTVIRAYNRLQQRLKTQHQSVLESSERITTLYNTTPAILFSLSLEAQIIEVNEHFLSYLGCSRESVIGTKLADYVNVSEGETLESVLIKPLLLNSIVRELFLEVNTTDLAKRPVLLEARIHSDAGEQKILAVMTDISGLIATQNQLDWQATHDALTSTYNRYGFQMQLERSVKKPHEQIKLALILLDLDHFKSINDIFGHHAGDALIRILSRRIQALLPTGALMARFGGDEFALLIFDRTDENILALSERLLACVSMPISLDESTMNLTASLGVAFYPKDALTTTELLQNADIAMYRAKQMGRGGMCFFERELQTSIAEKARYESILRNALSKQALLVYYQPIVDLATGKVMGTEALVRLEDPVTGALIGPDNFIGIAEETGLIILLGEQVLQQAITATQVWRQQFSKDLYISVNFSNRQFQQTHIVDMVTESLQQAGLPAELLYVELTESLLIQDNVHNQAVLRALHKLGCKLVIDDFGTGYSALSYLHQFPIDVLKIDRSFIADCQLDETDQSLVKAILNMSLGLGVVVVAEGIENPAQQTFLNDRGCQLGQGYYFSRPLAQMDMTHFLENNL